MPERLTRPGRGAALSAVRHYCYAVPTALAPQHLPLDACIGRVSARDVLARYDVPHFASSAMDGWAVSGAPPWRLIAGSRLRGSSLTPGQAVPVVTGGLIPAGATAVLRTEHGSVLAEPDGRLAPSPGCGAPTEGHDIRPAGEEVRRSEAVVAAGTRLNPAHVALCAVCGHDTLPVLARPRVALLLTGDEVIDSGIPRPGQVRDTFGPALPAYIGLLGADVVTRRRLPDDRALLVAAVTECHDTQVIITTGGTGFSRADHLHAALHELGADLLADGIAMRPGGPSVLARLPDGRFVVGLPGNPLAAMVATLVLVQPLLAGLAGAPEPAVGAVPVGHDLDGRAGRARLLPYRLEGGVALANPWHGSHMLRGLAQADGVMVVPPTGASTNDCLMALPLPW